LKVMWVAVFDTYMAGDFEKAVKKVEKQLGEKVPWLKLITSGLSVRVGGMEGPIVERELPKCRDLGEKLRFSLCVLDEFLCFQPSFC